MGILGIVAILLFSNIAYTANNLPVKVEPINGQSYFDITKPEALKFIKSTIYDLMLTERLTRLGQSKIKEYSSSNYSQVEWENFLNSFKNSVIFQDSKLTTNNVIKNIDIAVAKLDYTYKKALEKHNHYYLKQTINTHFEYLQVIKSTKEQLLVFRSAYSDLQSSNNELSNAINESLSPNNKKMNETLDKYANLLEYSIHDLKFLRSELEKAFKKHSHYALLEQQNSLSRLHTEKNRRLYLAAKTLDQMKDMARIAEAALNLENKVPTNEVIELIESSKKNLKPSYNQIMQVLDFEKILPKNSVMNEFESLLRTQAEILHNYLLSLEYNLKEEELKNKHTEKKYHLSFHKQMQAQVKLLSALRCQIVFK